jgi:tetratricopeptide (TPR) repeat protein
VRLLQISLWRQYTRFLPLLWLLLLTPAGRAEAPSPAFEAYRQAGEKAFAQNSYALAEKNFLSALKLAESEKFPAEDPRWATAYKNLASLYDVRSQFPKSELFLEKELRAREKALGSEHPQVIASVARLCRFYMLHGNAAKADRLSGLLLGYSERVLKDEQKLDGHFSELDKFFAAHREYGEIGKKFQSLKESADKVRADDHLELASNLDSVAAAYKERSKFACAEKLYRLSLSLREKALVPGHLALAFGYENLGNLYQAQGKNELAAPLFQQALEVTSKTLDFKRPEVYSRLDNLARSYISIGQNSEAESLYKRALSLIKDNCGARHRDYGSASFALASLYMKQGRFAEAEPLLKTALSISEGINGPQSASLIPVLDAYAGALEKTSKSSEATRIRHRANTIRGSAAACDTTTQAASF